MQYFERRQFFLQNRSPFTPQQTHSDRPILSVTRRSSYRSYILTIGICHTLRCLTEKCLTLTREVDRAAAFTAAPITHTEHVGARYLCDALSPSYTSCSMIVLQLSKTKVLQHFCAQSGFKRFCRSLPVLKNGIDFASTQTISPVRGLRRRPPAR